MTSASDHGENSALVTERGSPCSERAPGPQLDERLAPDVTFLEGPERRLCFDVGERGKLELTPPSVVLAEALRALTRGLTAAVRAELERRPDFDPARFAYYRLRLRKRRMLESGLRGATGDLLTVIPHRISFEIGSQPVPTGAVKLSRFAYTHTTERGLVLASPEASCEIVLMAPRTALWLHGLAHGTVDDHADDVERAAVVDLLWRCGFLERTDEPETEARRCWQFHDRLFHAASRPGDVLWSFGGSYRFERAFPSPPAVKARFAGDRIDLETPDRVALAAHSDRLFDVLERRRSYRAMGDPPIRLAQIGELLYRVARTVHVLDAPLQETMIRVFPSGGAIHEIEFYLSVRQCQDLDPGFYHYHGVDHALCRLPNAEAQAAAIVARAGEDWAQPDAPPQVVITLASRVPRIAWKYDTVAYRATLMNAGVIVQTIYLVATDMGLGCAPAGRGDPARFAAATGLDSFEETSVLEIGLGTRDPDAPSLVSALARRFGTLPGD